MKTQSKDKDKTKDSGERYVNGVPQTFMDRNLLKVNPKDEQFEPTGEDAVRQRYKMAGGC